VIWILNAYTIAFAGLLLVSGRLGDLFGHRRMFLAGLLWFSIWAVVVSFSTSPLMFIIARALQGMGAAGTVPTAMALIATNFPPGPERTKAFSVFAAFGGLGAVTGILLAGGLIASIGWPWIFRISAIAGFLLFVLGFLAIPITPPKAERPKVDFIGAATVTLGVTGVVYYISMGVEDGWASPKTLPIFFAGVILLGSFIFAESKVQSPLMPLRIWKSKSFASSVVLAFVSMGMFQGVIYYTNMVFQEVYGWTPIQTALGFLVHSLLAVVVFTILGRVMPRLSLKPLIMIGFLLRCITALMFAFMHEQTAYWAIPFPALIIHIFGVGFSLLPIQVTAVRDAANKDQGLVGAIYNTGLQMGAPFGIAVFNVIALSTNGNADGAVEGGPILMKGYKSAFFGIVGFGILGFVLAFGLLPWDKPNRTAKTVGAAAKSEDLEQGRASNDSEFESEVSTIADVQITEPTKPTATHV
jgi:MFS family permease